MWSLRRIINFEPKPFPLLDLDESICSNKYEIGRCARITRRKITIKSVTIELLGIQYSLITTDWDAGLFEMTKIRFVD